MSASLFLVVFGVYLVAITLFGIYVSRKQSTGEDFLLAGRKVGVVLLMGTTIATCIGTGSTMGAVGTGYSSGWLGAIYGIATGSGLILTALLFADAREKRFVTMSEEVSFYYGGNRLMKGLIGFLVFLTSVGYLGGHIVGGGMYLSWATGIDLTLAKALTAIGFGLFTVIGGYIAVIWTDTIMAFVLFFGFLIMAILSVIMVGGFDVLVAKAGSPAFLSIDTLGWGAFLSIMVPGSVAIIATPSFRQRVYSGKDTNTVRKSILVSGIFCALFSFIPAIIGVSASILLPDLKQSNFAFPQMAAVVMPLAIGIVVIIAGLSATLSSASSDAMAGTSILVRDVYPIFAGGKQVPEDKVVLYSRISLILTIIVSIGFAINADDVLSYLTKMLSTITTGTAVAILFGKFWKRTTWQGGMAAIFGGSFTSISVMTIPYLTATFSHPAVPALIMAVVLCVLVSLCTKREEFDEAEVLKRLEEERTI